MDVPVVRLNDGRDVAQTNNNGRCVDLSCAKYKRDNPPHHIVMFDATRYIIDRRASKHVIVSVLF